MAIAVSNNGVISSVSSNPEETQPNMGERTVVNSTDKIKALCQECRTKQGKVDDVDKKRNWIATAVLVVGLALFIIGIVLLITHSAGLAILLPLILVGAFSARLAPALLSRDKSYEEAAKALEANENGFLPFAETNGVELKVGNVVKAHKLYETDMRFNEGQRRQEKKHQEYLQPRLKELRA